MKHIINISLAWLLVIRFLFYDEQYVFTNIIAVATSFVLVKVRNVWLTKLALFISSIYLLSSILRLNYNIHTSDFIGVCVVVFLLTYNSYSTKWN